MSINNLWGPPSAAANAQDDAELQLIIRALPRNSEKIKQILTDLANPDGGRYYPALLNPYFSLVENRIVPLKLLARLVIRRQNNYLSAQQYEPTMAHFETLLRERPVLVRWALPDDPAVRQFPELQEAAIHQLSQEQVERQQRRRAARMAQNQGQTPQAGGGAQAGAWLPVQRLEPRQNEPPLPFYGDDENENDADDQASVVRFFDDVDSYMFGLDQPTATDRLRSASATTQMHRRQARRASQRLDALAQSRHQAHRLAAHLDPNESMQGIGPIDGMSNEEMALSLRRNLSDPFYVGWLPMEAAEYARDMGWSTRETYEKIRDTNARYLLRLGTPINPLSEDGQSIKQFFVDIQAAIDKLKLEEEADAANIGNLIATVMKEQKHARRKKAKAAPRTPSKK